MIDRLPCTCNMFLQPPSSTAACSCPGRSIRWLVAGERELSEGIPGRLAGGQILAHSIEPIEELQWMTLLSLICNCQTSMYSVNRGLITDRVGWLSSGETDGPDGQRLGIETQTTIVLTANNLGNFNHALIWNAKVDKEPSYSQTYALLFQPSLWASYSRR